MTTKVEREIQKDALVKNMQSRGFLLRCEIGTYGIRRAVDIDEVDVDADKSKIDVKKYILDRPEYDILLRQVTRIKKVLRHYAIPTPTLGNGRYLIPNAYYDEVMKRLDEFQAERPKLVDELVEVLPDAKREAKRFLKKLYDEADYPSAATLHAACRIRVTVYEEVVPGRLKEVDRAAYERQQKVLADRIAEAGYRIAQMQRLALHELTAHLAAKLKVEEGKEKVLRKSAIENVQAYLETFDPKNVADDKALAEEVKKMRKLLSGVSIEDLKDDEALRAKLQKDVEAVKKALDPMIETIDGARRLRRKAEVKS